MNFLKEKNCISLIGMPGAGKSTVGVNKTYGTRLRRYGYSYSKPRGSNSSDIIDCAGYQHLRRIEEK